MGAKPDQNNLPIKTEMMLNHAQTIMATIRVIGRLCFVKKSFMTELQEGTLRILLLSRFCHNWRQYRRQ